MNFDGAAAGGDGGTLYPAGGPHGSYYEAGDFTFSPANLTNAQHCADGKCVQEFKNGDVGILERSSGGAFDLEGFYFNLTGNGDDKDNYVFVEAFSGAVSVGTLTIALADTLSSFAPAYTISLAKTIGGGVCKDDTNTNFDRAVKVCKNQGYTVDILAGGFFSNVTSVSFKASADAQLRIDDLMVTPVPLPAAGLLLLGGLGALGALRRRA